MTITPKRLFENPWRYAISHPENMIMYATLTHNLLVIIDRKFWNTTTKQKLRRHLRNAKRRRNLLFIYNTLDVYDSRGRNVRHVNLSRLAV